MAIEQAWSAVAPQLFTANGTTLGVVTVGTTAGFKVKQQVVISTSGDGGLPDLTLQCKRVVSETQLIVGPVPITIGQDSLTARTDISAYTTSLSAYIYAEEQPKVRLKVQDIEQAVYDQEPTVAYRSVLVDEWGNYYSSITDQEGNNRLAVDAAVSITIPPGTIPSQWDDIVLDYDANNNLTEVQYFLQSTLERTLNLTYDDNGNLIGVTATPSP